MAQFPSLPLWTDAYLADTAHLTDSEHGVYLQLLMLIWRSPECRIPNDDKWLSRRFRRPADAIAETVRPMIIEFCKSDGNWITQGRLKDEWTYCKNLSKSQSARAKSRWDKEKALCPDDADTHEAGTAPIPIPIPIPKKKEPFVYPADYLEFYNEWPVNEGKKPGYKSYLKARKIADHKTIMEGLIKYKENKPDWKNWKAITTWLNNECWLDEHETAPEKLSDDGVKNLFKDAELKYGGKANG